jgi:hypothetical protein
MRDAPSLLSLCYRKSSVNNVCVLAIFHWDCEAQLLVLVQTERLTHQGPSANWGKSEVQFVVSNLTF